VLDLSWYEKKKLISPNEKVTVNEFCPALVTGVTACVDCILVGCKCGASWILLQS
jgi:hypothetical protein